jgi:SAM-dependent methyltransferase
VSDNLVRDIHDAVAGSENPAEASVRPSGTTRRELRTMQRDVLGKLRLRPWMTVAEIGCGVGLLGVPVAERCARYVGIDFAPRAVQAANERLRAAGVGERAQALCLDLLGVSEEDLDGLGCFDRVLVYAAFHYVRSEQEAVRFLQRTCNLMAPGGMALVGNIPLSDLDVDWSPSEPSPRGLIARSVALGRWIAIPGSAPVPLTPWWKVRRTFETILKARSRRPIGDFPPARLPSKYTLPLTTGAIDAWVAALDGDLTHRWRLPAPGAPLAHSRADLIVNRR